MLGVLMQRTTGPEALRGQGSGKEVPFGERGNTEHGCLDNGRAVASVLALQFGSPVKTDEPWSFVLSQERVLGGDITAGITRAQSSRDHSEKCVCTWCAAVLPAGVGLCQLSLTLQKL